MDQEALRRKNEELSLAYKEKNRKLLQTQELYDKLKRKAMLGHIQDAASDAVDNTLHSGQNPGARLTEVFENHDAFGMQYGTPFGAPRFTDRVEHLAAAPPQSRMVPLEAQNPTWARSIPHQGAQHQGECYRRMSQ